MTGCVTPFKQGERNDCIRARSYDSYCRVPEVTSAKSLEDKLLELCGIDAGGLTIHLVQWDDSKPPGNRATFRVLPSSETAEEPFIVVAATAASLSFACPFCRTTHRHIACPGHVVAQCTTGPLQGRGYVLERRQSGQAH